MTVHLVCPLSRCFDFILTTEFVVQRHVALCCQSRLESARFAQSPAPTRAERFLTLLEQIAHFLSGHVAILQTVGKCTLRVHQTTAVAQFVNLGFIRRCAMCEALISGGATRNEKLVCKKIRDRFKWTQ